MAQIIGLPKLSPTMEEGVLAKWTRKEGDKVSPGDVIAEVETDKANMDFALEDEGTLLKLLVAEGDTVKLGAPVAILGKPGEDVAALVAEAKQAMGAGAAATSTAAPVAEAKAQAVEEKPPEPKPEPKPAPAPAPAPGDGAPGRLLASPIAKTLAAEHGIDLRTLRGSGPGGRIVERDVREAMQGKAPVAKPAPAPITPPSTEDVDRPMSMLRKTLARRLVEAKQAIPHFYLTTDCDAAPLMGFRAQLNALVDESQKISVNDLVVKAAALTLRRVPTVNAALIGDKIRQFGRVHVGVAVSIEDGLITPVVRDTDVKTLARISAEVKDLAARARQKKVTPEEMSGGTFTVSNLGMYGLDHFQAIINPPEGAILAVGAVKRQPVVLEDGSLAAGQRMALTLSCDHRVVDGALGARFLAELVKLLEHPAGLAL